MYHDADGRLCADTASDLEGEATDFDVSLPKVDAGTERLLSNEVELELLPLVLGLHVDTGGADRGPLHRAGEDDTTEVFMRLSELWLMPGGSTSR